MQLAGRQKEFYSHQMRGVKNENKSMLNSGSTINEGRFAKGGDKLSPGYQEECAVAVIHPGYLKNLVAGSCENNFK